MNIETRDVTRNGVTYRVAIEDSQTETRPENDGDWATPEDIEAWKLNRWHYVDMTITPIFDGIAIATASKLVPRMVYGSLATRTIGMNELIENHVGDYIGEVNELLSDVLPDLISALQAFKP